MVDTLISFCGSRKVFDGYDASAIHGWSKREAVGLLASSAGRCARLPRELGLPLRGCAPGGTGVMGAWTPRSTGGDPHAVCGNGRAENARLRRENSACAWSGRSLKRRPAPVCK